MKKFVTFIAVLLMCFSISCTIMTKKDKRKISEVKEEVLVSLLNIGTQYYDIQAKSRKTLWENRGPVIAAEIEERIKNSVGNLPKNKLIGLVEMNLKTLSDFDPVIRENGYAYLYQPYKKTELKEPYNSEKPFDDHPMAQKFKEILKAKNVPFKGYNIYDYTINVQDDLKFYGEMLVLIYNPKIFELKESESIFLDKGTYIDGKDEVQWQRHDRSLIRAKFLNQKLNRHLVIYLTHLDHQSLNSRTENVKSISKMAFRDLEQGNKSIVLGDWNNYDIEGKMDLKIFGPLRAFSRDLTSEGISGFKDCESPTFVDYPGETRNSEILCIDRIFGSGDVLSEWGQLLDLRGASDHKLIEVIAKY